MFVSLPYIIISQSVNIFFLSEKVIFKSNQMFCSVDQPHPVSTKDEAQRERGNVMGAHVLWT